MTTRPKPPADLKTPHGRLQHAREAAQYASAALAARAMGVLEPVYQAHENGSKGLSRSGARYAKFFNVALDWLMTGRGEMKPVTRYAALPAIPLMGLVGAGGSVAPIDGDNQDEPPDFIDWPEPAFIGALQVRGESQLPRWRDGEVILFDRRPRKPDEFLGKYAVVDCLDGRRLVKTIQRGSIREPRGEFWRLDSLNAPPEDNVRLLAAYEIWPRPRK